jgi:hypothetical protein
MPPEPDAYARTFNAVAAAYVFRPGVWGTQFS